MPVAVYRAYGAHRGEEQLLDESTTILAASVMAMVTNDQHSTLHCNLAQPMASTRSREPRSLGEDGRSTDQILFG
ncbi:hypothetical protein ON010_g3996 [Phytophthora cinnamomi]|nr:hypothetical protein ON010_g3996 [Phytophthora cinnamomi]